MQCLLKNNNINTSENVGSNGRRSCEGTADDSEKNEMTLRIAKEVFVKGEELENAPAGKRQNR